MSFRDDPVESPKQKDINNHISSIEVYNGDDEYNATTGIKLSPKGYEGIVLETQDLKGMHTRYRTRGELGIIINLESESGESWKIVIAHHKGCVYVEASDKNPYEPRPNFDPTKWLNKTENTLQT